MADTKTFLRFPGRKEFLGLSRYRPSEGWIETVDASLWRPHSSSSVAATGSTTQKNAVEIGTAFIYLPINHKAVRHLWLAASELQVFDQAVLERWSTQSWVRLEMKTVSLMSHVSVSGEMVQFGLECPKPVMTLGDLPKFYPNWVSG